MQLLVEEHDQIRIGTFAKEYVNIYYGFPIKFDEDPRQQIDPVKDVAFRSGPTKLVEIGYKVLDCSTGEDRAVPSKVVGFANQDSNRTSWGAVGAVNPNCVRECGTNGGKATFNEVYRNTNQSNDATVDPAFASDTILSLAPDEIDQELDFDDDNGSVNAVAGCCLKINRQNGDADIAFQWNDTGTNMKILKDKSTRRTAAEEVQRSLGAAIYSNFSSDRWFYELKHDFGNQNYMCMVQGLTNHSGVKNKIIYKNNSVIIAQYWDSSKSALYGRDNYIELPDRLDILFYK